MHKRVNVFLPPASTATIRAASRLTRSSENTRIFKWNFQKNLMNIKTGGHAPKSSRMLCVDVEASAQNINGIERGQLGDVPFLVMTRAYVKVPPHPFSRCLFDLVGTRGFIRDQMLYRSMVKHFSGTSQESAREVK